MAELKPCPFCGEVPKAEWTQGVYLPHLTLHHQDKSDCALAISVIIFAEDKDAAIEKWNRRVDNG